MALGKKQLSGVPAVFVLARWHHGGAAFCVCGVPLRTDAPLALRVHVFDGFKLRGLCRDCGRRCDPALSRLTEVLAEGGTPGSPRECVEGGAYLLNELVQIEVVDVALTVREVPAG